MQQRRQGRLLVGGVLGHGLGALGDGVFGQLTRQDKADGSLNLAAGERLALGVADELASLSADALEDVVHERVHDRHGLLGHTRVGVDLLQDLVDVHREGLGALLLLLALGGLLFGWGLLGGIVKVVGGLVWSAVSV